VNTDEKSLCIGVSETFAMLVGNWVEPPTTNIAGRRVLFVCLKLNFFLLTKFNLDDRVVVTTIQQTTEYGNCFLNPYLILDGRNKQYNAMRRRLYLQFDH
jgi:hypothetical protein